MKQSERIITKARYQELIEKELTPLKEKEIRHKAINAYLNFMSINASAQKIASGLLVWKLCVAIDYTGCSKSDIAKDFATNYGDAFKPETLKVLLTNFGSK